MNENRFVFISPVFNASSTLEQMLLSIVGQSFTNWKVVLIDDMSTDDERIEQRKIVERFREFLRVGKDRIKYHENSLKKWEVENVLWGIKNECSDYDIVCRLDGDDWLTDLDALHIINKRYVERQIDVLWSGHRWGFSDMNISGPMESCQDPYLHPWVSSHFKTCKKKLLNDVPIENFRGEDGNFIRRAGDQALYLPAMHNAKGKWWFEPRVMYHYTIDVTGGAVFQTDDAKFQKNEAEFIRNRGYVDVGERWENFF